MIRGTIWMILLIFFFQSGLRGDIVLNEVMFDPIGNENYDEFLEIYNTSSSDTVDLTGWTISDGLDTDTLTATGEGLLLAPGQFGLILDSGYFGNSQTYDPLPPEALILTVSDAALGSGGFNNTVAETILFKNSLSETIAFYPYSLGNLPGYSDEKINPKGGDNPSNWGNSSCLNGTPGRWNSISPYSCDLRVSSTDFSFFPSHPQSNGQVEISLEVHNEGTTTAFQVEVIFFCDFDSDSIFDPNEGIGSPQIIPSIEPDHSETARVTWTNLLEGIQVVSGKVFYSLDEDTLNNRAWSKLLVGNPPLVINEIMYSPKSDSSEWIELYNRSSASLDLKDWTIEDSRQEPVKIRSSSLLCPPGSYLLLVEDLFLFKMQYPDIDSNLVLQPIDGWNDLNNNTQSGKSYADILILRESTGLAIDSVPYDDSWGGGAGISLERKSPEESSLDSLNWSSSHALRGATPASSNSVSILYDLGFDSISLYFLPLHPQKGEDVTIFAIVHNYGIKPVSTASIKFFEDKNGNGFLDSGEEIGSSQTVSGPLPPLIGVDTVSVNWERVGGGTHRVYTQIEYPLDERKENNTCFKVLRVSSGFSEVVVNEIFYHPGETGTEWIELYNCSQEEVLIKDWTIEDSDSSHPRLITSLLFSIPPTGFVILSPDSSWPKVSCPLLVPQGGWPTLNDEVDKIFLRDSEGSIVDGLSYRSSWGGGDGISLERINPRLPSTDSLNWGSCVEKGGATPGRTNSIYCQVLPQTTTLSAFPNPFSPDGDGHDDRTLISFKLPFTRGRVRLYVYDLKGRLLNRLLDQDETGSEGSVIWDGKREGGETLPMGIYLLYLEGVDFQREKVITVKKSLVLARKL